MIETPVRRGYTFESVAFYELRGDKWVALQSPAGDLSKGSQLAQSLKQHLPKKFNPRDCAPDRDVLKLHEWTDIIRQSFMRRVMGASRIKWRPRSCLQ